MVKSKVSSLLGLVLGVCLSRVECRVIGCLVGYLPVHGHEQKNSKRIGNICSVNLHEDRANKATLHLVLEIPISIQNIIVLALGSSEDGGAVADEMKMMMNREIDSTIRRRSGSSRRSRGIVGSPGNK